ncbi:MAG: hypothetical protein ABIN23_03050 [candidate division WOR-3 bacterium]
MIEATERISDEGNKRLIKVIMIFFNSIRLQEILFKSFNIGIFP